MMVRVFVFLCVTICTDGKELLVVKLLVTKQESRRWPQALLVVLFSTSVFFSQRCPQGGSEGIHFCEIILESISLVLW